jgi:ATP synthase protein I
MLDSRLGKAVGEQEKRKLRTRQQAVKSIWFGFGTFGLIGWSVAVPALLGAWLGLKLDQRYPAQHSWTLTLLILGLAIGSLNAWRWVVREDRALRELQND